MLCRPIAGGSTGRGQQQIKRESSSSANASDTANGTVSDDVDANSQIQYCANTAIQTRAFPAVEVFLTDPQSEPVPEPGPEQQVLLCNDDNESAAAAAAAAVAERRNSARSNVKTKGNSSSSKSSQRKRTVDSHRGHGLRLLEPVKAGTILSEYLGEVITAEEGLRRMAGYAPGEDFYFAGLASGLMLDAKVMGSVARFANHSCDPSCLLQKWVVPGPSGRDRIALVAKYDLPAGAEVRAALLCFALLFLLFFVLGSYFCLLH
jgi:hypothetical protein